MIDFQRLDSGNKHEMEKCIGSVVKFADSWQHAPSYTLFTYVISDVLWNEQYGYYNFRIRDIGTNEYYNGIKSENTDIIEGGFAANKFKDYPEGKKLYRNNKLEKILI